MNEKITLLIVDDQLAGREVLRGLLGDQGYELAFAENGREALKKAAELAPDLILLDVMMPEMDGFTVCHRLRNNPELAEIPVIMVTALDDLNSRLRGLEVGADDFIAKPFNHAELKARIRTITRLNRQRQQNMEELQAERDRTTAILEALGEAVVVTDDQGTIEYVNPAITSLTGYMSEEVLGQSWRLWQSEETEANLYDSILEQVKQGHTWRGEVVNKRKDGMLYDAALTVAPLSAAQQPASSPGFVSVQRDITPIKRAERAKNEFVSNVSHELRTPLSVLTLVSDNLDSLYERLDDEKRRKMIKDIQKHTQVLNDLIGDVLEISRIDSGRVSMHRKVVDLAQLAQTEGEELLPLAEQKSQTLQIKATLPLNVWGNKAQLRQIVRNLLNNAIKYTPDEGQIMCHAMVISSDKAEAMDESVWPGKSNLPGGTWAAVCVTDTGIGIESQHLSQIFNRFYRVKAQRNIRGTGLGLSIARQLVELHNGHIAVASTPGKGSSFAVYLPVANNKE